MPSRGEGAPAFARLVEITCRLHFRNLMALAYGHLFPATMVFVFAGLYAAERDPLLRHLGDLLAITALSGACFGMPISLVNERERGIWRHYRLAPVGVGGVLVPATLVARFTLLLLAAALQLALALALGMSAPAHPLQLAMAYAFAAFAFLGLGLLLSVLADTVYGVQALAQSIFIPMLIVSGVAVPVSALPGWVQRLSAFLPGRYAIEILQACATGAGLGGLGFHLAALVATGLCAILAGAIVLARSGSERSVPLASKAYASAALVPWVVVGALAITSGPYAPPASRVASAVEPTAAPVPATLPAPGAPVGADSGAPPPAGTGTAPSPGPGEESATEEPAGLLAIDRDVDYSALPPDDGLVAPVARPGEVPPPEVSDQVECMRMMIPGWGPARVADPVQRVRNHLYVAAAADVYQTGELERWVPLMIQERLESELGREELARILHRIAASPGEGDLSAAGPLSGACFDRAAPSDEAEVRERMRFYALKLLGRVTGRIPSR